MSTTEDRSSLIGLQLLLSKPRVIAETKVGFCWYPDLLKFSTGELMLTHSLNPDRNDNLHNSQQVCVSTDGGQNFGFCYDVSGFHNSGGEPRISLPDGRIVGVSTFLKPDPFSQNCRFVAHRWTYDNGGRRYTVEPWGASVEGLPRDVDRWPEPSRTWWSRINWFSDIIPLEDGGFLSTISLAYAGDKLETTVAVVSDDECRNWRYVSTIATPEDVPDAREGFDEPCLLRLADGDIMCISRVGSLEDQKLARSYSSDEGRTWSPVDRLEAYSVAPQLLRLQNETIVLCTGRPGLTLWFSSDPKGKSWQSWDILAYHNSVMDADSQIGDAHDANQERSPLTTAQTTDYTAMIEVSPNRIFLVYDRTPFGWVQVPAGSGEASRIYLLELTVAN
jgi:hypothetical protein